MKKILMIGLCAFLMLITLTGCDKKENNNTNTSYYRSIDYNTLLEASGSRDDSFIVLFYDENGLNSKYTKETLETYANTNKVTIYEFNMTKYLKQYEIDNANEMNATKEEFVAQCMAITDDEEEIDEEPTYERVCDEYDEEGNCVSSHMEEINASTDTKVTYLYTKAECEDFHVDNFKYNRKMEIFNQYSISSEGTVVFMDKTFKSATFSDYVPGLFNRLQKSEQEEILNKSKNELIVWLDGLFKEHGVENKK